MKRALALLSLLALPVFAAEPNLYSRYEWASLPELDRTLQAKMDTGAYTSSLPVKGIELFWRDGEEWVRFCLVTKEADGSAFEHRLARIGKIRNRADNRNGEDEDEDCLDERPVIDLQVCLGGAMKTIEVNLTDHSASNYLFLMGTKGLRKFHVTADPSEYFIADKSTCKQASYATSGAIDARVGLRHRSDIPVNRRHAIPHTLIVEDEVAITDTLLYTLQAEGFATTWVALAGETLVLQECQPTDLLILDVGLPDISGFEACERLQRFSEVPVIFPTVRDAEIDRVVGLEIGADDYVVKSFSPREVAARVKAILRCMASCPAALEGAIPSGLFQVDEERVRIHYRGTSLNLTCHEFRLLQTLLGQPERVSSREQLLDALGVTNEAGHERSTGSHIKNLRAKLRQVNERGEAIRTHRGLGYSYGPDHA